MFFSFYISKYIIWKIKLNVQMFMVWWQKILQKLLHSCVKLSLNFHEHKYTLFLGCLNKAAAAKIVCRSFTGVRKHTSVILLQLHISRNIQTCSTHFFPKTSETSILLGTKQHSFCIYNHNRNKLLSQQFSSQKRLYSTIPVSPR